MSKSLTIPAFVLAFAACTLSAPAQQTAAPATPPTPADTATVSAAHGVRIVRLSEVNGAVQLDRGTHEFETAFNNLPIVEGARLRTGDGTAEVEFEDGSSLRLTPNSQVEFPVLSAERNGNRQTTIHVTAGQVYASMVKPQRGVPNVDAPLNLAFGERGITLTPGAHVLFSMSPGAPRLDVLDGSVQVTGDGGTQMVAKKKGLVFDSAAPTLVSKREPGPFDDWDKRSVQYHSQFASMNQMRGSGYQYGVADLNYYGSFLSGGSCSGMWRPYFASANWSPYSNGVWAYYPSAGYSYVSQYPWAWAPYHSGSWGYCPGVGYGWTPGNNWNGVNNVAALNTPGRNAPVGPNQLRPPHPPTPGPGSGLVPVNYDPRSASGIVPKSGSFTFRGNSAGLGVPRGVFGKLDGVSNHAVQHGNVERPIYLAPPSSPAAASMMSHSHALAATHITTAAPAAQMGNAQMTPSGMGASGMGTPGAGNRGSMGAGTYSSPHTGPVGVSGGPSMGGGAGAGATHAGGGGASHH